MTSVLGECQRKWWHTPSSVFTSNPDVKGPAKGPALGSVFGIRKATEAHYTTYTDLMWSLPDIGGNAPKHRGTGDHTGELFKGTVTLIKSLYLLHVSKSAICVICGQFDLMHKSRNNLSNMISNVHFHHLCVYEPAPYGPTVFRTPDIRYIGALLWSVGRWKWCRTAE